MHTGLCTAKHLIQIDKTWCWRQIGLTVFFYKYGSEI